MSYGLANEYQLDFHIMNEVFFVIPLLCVWFECQIFIYIKNNSIRVYLSLQPSLMWIGFQLFVFKMFIPNVFPMFKVSSFLF